MMIPDSVIHEMRRLSSYGIFYGRVGSPSDMAYMQRCTHLHARSGTLVIFTRDAGHHSGGWMKNPDFERCRHVSLSFRAPQPEMPDDRLMSPAILQQFGANLPLAPFDRALAIEWVKALLHPDHRMAWREPAFSTRGKQHEVEHWRLFCDPGWQPIHPRGEVYSREFCEAGWQSWSEVQGEDAEPNPVSAE